MSSVGASCESTNATKFFNRIPLLDVGVSIETFLKEVKPVITEKHEFEYENEFFLSLLEPSYRDLMEGLENLF